MDWIPDEAASPAASEASGDSEADSVLIHPPMAVEFGDDDAESSSGGCDGENDDAQRDERWMSWGSWLVEYAARCEHSECGDEEGEDGLLADNAGEEEEVLARMEAESTVADEGERNRLFWEACLADGYP